jgi:hypothetical protein
MPKRTVLTATFRATNSWGKTVWIDRFTHYVRDPSLSDPGQRVEGLSEFRTVADGRTLSRIAQSTYLNVETGETLTAQEGPDMPE